MVRLALFICYSSRDGGVVKLSRKCEVCDKGVVFGGQYSHSHRRSNRKWTPNLRKVKAVVNNSPKTIKVCTRCLRSGKVQRSV